MKESDSPANIVKFPFTLYDIFGYLIPGATLIISILLAHDLIGMVKLIWFHGNGQYPADEMPHYLGMIAECYKESAIVTTVFALLVSYVTGHAIAVGSSFVLEKFALEFFIGYPAVTMFKLDAKGMPKWKRTLRRCWGVSHYARPFSPEFIETFQELFSKRFQGKFKDARDMFWLSFELVSMNCPNAFLRVMHFLSMYGFSRNMSFAFLLSSLLLLPYCWAHGGLSWIVWLAYVVLVMAFYLNYMKLLRRLNDEVFRATYVFLSTPPKNTSM